MQARLLEGKTRDGRGRARDVDQLLGSSGLGAWTYHELRAAEEEAAAIARWPLLKAVARALSDGHREEATDEHAAVADDEDAP